MGPELQAGAIRDYCAYRKWDLELLEPDIGISGSVPLADRPNGAELLERVKAGCSRIIVFKLDRLGRSVSDVSALIQQFRRRGVHLVSVSEHLDLGTGMGKAMAHMLATFAELERDMGSDRMRGLHRSLKELGRKQSRTAPYGWDVGPGKLLVPNDQEQATIRRIRNLSTRGHSEVQIAEILNSEQIPGKTGGRWSHSTVKKVLARPPMKQPRADVPPADQADVNSPPAVMPPAPSSPPSSTPASASTEPPAAPPGPAGEPEQ